MKVYWAIGAALLVAGPIMAVPSDKPAPSPNVVLDVAHVELGDAVELRR